MQPLVIDIFCGSYVVIEPEVIKTISRYKQLSVGDREAGGILIGCYKGRHLHISYATSPGPKDKATRVRFMRNCDSHWNIALIKWKKSNFKQTFIGDWHTHPEDYPTPSSIDYYYWNKNLPENKDSIVIIQGRKGIWIGHCNHDKKINVIYE
ncbi:TPA: Mov34/MPN/PAD-1 family protein [Vibrio parahaemolyticus]|uniref:Mov34/MPN/PAD-1 family protein n=1 Tax=Vibrio harveyi group TaxID=717610 RepID=UPI0004A3A1BA|nr:MULTISPECIES: Mov34/MPN/PAD-1 family protein [Vibrio harveyi group]MBE3903072.1 peptidase [Vibrio parahaemolyticus]MCS0450667.1 Mov34/MPN/PAD-1 family protein [Vibrio diabolicus]OCP40554.1 hypothetical protein AKH06_20690 [Vibrio parahaemolyticus]OCP44825.1 hypothetical protein AKH02_12060 [Vibrio parahaemolyticus]HCE2680069.1 Mov34/MPN/PAD-1 family protein [Vibrio parahaemolyticus]